MCVVFLHPSMLGIWIVSSLGQLQTLVWDDYKHYSCEKSYIAVLVKMCKSFSKSHSYIWKGHRVFACSALRNEQTVFSKVALTHTPTSQV